MELRVKGFEESFGETLKRARDDADLTQVELAAKLGVAPRTVQYWEAGNIPQPRHRRAIAAFLEEARAA